MTRYLSSRDTPPHSAGICNDGKNGLGTLGNAAPVINRHDCPGSHGWVNVLRSFLHRRRIVREKPGFSVSVIPLYPAGESTSNNAPGIIENDQYSLPGHLAIHHQ